MHNIFVLFGLGATLGFGPDSELKDHYWQNLQNHMWYRERQMIDPLDYFNNVNIKLLEPLFRAIQI